MMVEERYPVVRRCIGKGCSVLNEGLWTLRLRGNHAMTCTPLCFPLSSGWAGLTRLGPELLSLLA